MPIIHRSVLALDVGGTRVGVALAGVEARLASPLTTLPNNSDLPAELSKIIEREEVGALVVGLPRGLSGQNTGQTETVQEFVAELKQRFDLPVHMQDEAVTSRQAETELESRGKPYKREDIDALAATYILEDWLKDNPGVNNAEI